MSLLTELNKTFIPMAQSWLLKAKEEPLQEKNPLRSLMIQFNLLKWINPLNHQEIRCTKIYKIVEISPESDIDKYAFEEEMKRVAHFLKGSISSGCLIRLLVFSENDFLPSFCSGVFAYQRNVADIRKIIQSDPFFYPQYKSLSSYTSHNKKTRYTDVLPFQELEAAFKAPLSKNEENSQDLATCLQKRGAYLEAVCHYPMAVNSYEKSMDIWYKIFNPLSTDTTAQDEIRHLSDKIGWLTLEKLDWDKFDCRTAEACLKKNRTIYSPNDRVISKGTYNISVVQYKLGLIDAALESAKKALDLSLNYYQPHTHQLDIAENFYLLGSIYETNEQELEALSQYKASYEIVKELYGESSEDALLLQSKIASNTPTMV